MGSSKAGMDQPEKLIICLPLRNPHVITLMEDGISSNSLPPHERTDNLALRELQSRGVLTKRVGGPKSGETHRLTIDLLVQMLSVRVKERDVS